MSSAKHTPTPWQVVTYSDKRTPVEIRTDQPIYEGASGTVLIAKLPHETVSPRENAAFIVEACNGYAALQAQNTALAARVERLEGALRDLVNAEYMVTNDFDGDRVPLIDAARAAIAKATGEQP